MKRWCEKYVLCCRPCCLRTPPPSPPPSCQNEVIIRKLARERLITIEGKFRLQQPAQTEDERSPLAAELKVSGIFSSFMSDSASVGPGGLCTGVLDSQYVVTQ